AHRTAIGCAGGGAHAVGWRDQVSLCFLIDGKSAFEIALKNGRESHTPGGLVTHSLAFNVKNSFHAISATGAHRLSNLYVIGCFVRGLSIGDHYQTHQNEKCLFHVVASTN